MKKQQKVIILFSKFCLLNNIQYSVTFSVGFIQRILLENKVFLLAVDSNGTATIYIHKTGEIFECKTQIQIAFAKIYEQIV